MSCYSVSDKQTLRWELNRAGQPELRWRPAKRAGTSSLVMLACGVALLAGVIFRLIDQWGAW